MQLTRTSGPVSVLASNGRRVVVGVVNDLACIYDRWTGELLRALPSDWSSDVLIDGDTVYLVAGATGALSAFGIVDGLRRPCASVAGARSVRSWTTSDGSSSGLVVGCHADYFRTFDAQHCQLAEFGLRQRLAAFAVRGTTVVAAYSAGPQRPGPVRVFDCRTGEALRVDPDGHEGAVLAVHLDAEGLVTASLDSTVRAYDPDFRFLRAQTLPTYVSRVHADPSDANVLHAIGPDAVMRLDRATLNVLDRVELKSSYTALAVDTVGRLVGVDGAVESLDPLPAAPVDPSVPDVHVTYEKDGYFDKDAQGWCATWTELAQDGRAVVLRTWFDENGATRSQQILRGQIGHVEGQLVHIAMEDGTTKCFDLSTRRLVS